LNAAIARKVFVVIAHTFPGGDQIRLDDLPGSGRCDELVRCITAALLVSNDVRRDSEIYLILGDGNEDRIIAFRGSTIRNLNPDERSTAALLRKALARESFIFDKEVHPGILLITGGAKELLAGLKERLLLIHLHEEGEKAGPSWISTRLAERGPNCEGIGVILSDRLNLTPEEMDMVREVCHESISLGPVSLHSHQAVIVFHNLLDRMTKI